ncbi:unnamed protein product [Blepharisma stoltei]|uniref:Transposase n=1 Tax=Blepharisma stoltei TaxID=1481888 RepID=A0AAU9IFB6_9CILI|nr:unnamed protein product [Blepharisma stoltei]
MDYRLLLRKWNDGESIVKRIIDVGFFKNEELATILGTSKRTIERIAAENTESESDEAAGREEALSRSPIKHWSDEDFAEVIKECEKDTGFVSKASLRAQFKRKTVDISEEQLGKELNKRGYVYRKKRVVLQLIKSRECPGLGLWLTQISLHGSSVMSAMCISFVTLICAKKG